MDPTGNPKKINRQVLKAVAHYTNKNNGTKFHYIYEFVRNCNKNGRPVADIKHSISTALFNLEKCGLVVKHPRKGYQFRSIELMNNKNNKRHNQRKSQSLKQNNSNDDNKLSNLRSRRNDESIIDSYLPRDKKKSVRFSTGRKMNDGVQKMQMKVKKLKNVGKNMKNRLKRCYSTTRIQNDDGFSQANRYGYHYGDSEDSDGTYNPGRRSDDTIESSIQDMELNETATENSSVSHDSHDNEERNEEGSECVSESGKLQQEDISEDVIMKEENVEGNPKNDEEIENSKRNASEDEVVITNSNNGNEN